MSDVEIDLTPLTKEHIARLVLLANTSLAQRKAMIMNADEMLSMIAEIRRHRVTIQAFADTVAAAVQANENRGKGGQQVPFHGDFCAATPSVLSRLEWWARNLRGDR